MADARPRVLVAEPLTAAAFTPYGTVLEAPVGEGRAINAGTSRRFDLVADLDLGRSGGRPMLAIYRASARRFPLSIAELERHVLGSQTFVALGEARFVVVVATGGESPAPEALRAFVTDGRQGVVLAAGTWHHGLLSTVEADYVVVERAASPVDCDTCAVAAEVRLRPL
jgi:ureidoglycolate lyase